MSHIIEYVYRGKSPCKNVPIQIGIDTVGFGFEADYRSWKEANRLKDKGWKWYKQKRSWNHYDPETGMRLFHLGPEGFRPTWCGGEVSLPRLSNGHNSSLHVNVLKSLCHLNEVVYDQLSYVSSFDRSWNKVDSAVHPPHFSEWRLRRVDVTIDILLPDSTTVANVLDQFRGMQMKYKRKYFEAAGGMKWSSKAGGVFVSAYDKEAKTKKDLENGRGTLFQLDLDHGKLRWTVGINGNRDQLAKTKLQFLADLYVKDRWLEVIRRAVKGIKDTDMRSWIGGVFQKIDAIV